MKDLPQHLNFYSPHLEMISRTAILFAHCKQSCLRYHFHPLAGSAIYLCFFDLIHENRNKNSSGFWTGRTGAKVKLTLRLFQSRNTFLISAPASFIHLYFHYSLLKMLHLDFLPAKFLNYNVLCPWESWRRFIRTRCQNVFPCPTSVWGRSSTWKDAVNSFCCSDI